MVVLISVYKMTLQLEVLVKADAAWPVFVNCKLLQKTFAYPQLLEELVEADGARPIFVNVCK